MHSDFATIATNYIWLKLSMQSIIVIIHSHKSVHIQMPLLRADTAKSW